MREIPTSNSPIWAMVLKTPQVMEAIFDSMPDVLFYIKDVEGLYLWVNQELVRRSGLKALSDVIGKTSDQLFPVPPPGTMSQDLQVIQSRRSAIEHLRLYRTRGGERYWCLSSKFPLIDDDDRVTGLAGISRDLPRPNERHRSYQRLTQFLSYVDSQLENGVLVSEAARKASISEDTLARMTHDVFEMTPKQLLIKRRIDKACELLEDTDYAVTLIASACGYADHSAFTRQFRVATHMTPTQYRSAHPGR